MKIGETLVTWKEGDVMVFDDSFEHEVWNNSDISCREFDCLVHCLS